MGTITKLTGYLKSGYLKYCFARSLCVFNCLSYDALCCPGPLSVRRLTSHPLPLPVTRAMSQNKSLLFVIYGIYCSLCCDKTYCKSKLREERFIWAQGVSGYSLS